MPYNERITIGKRKGRFVKKKVKSRMENASEVISKKKDESQATGEIEEHHGNSDCTPQTTDKIRKLPKIEDIRVGVSKCKYIVQGRRLVDVGLLAKELWCKNCDLPLSLRFVVSEKRAGLASTFKIKCSKCENIYDVGTSKRTQSKLYYENLLSAIGN